MEEHTNKNDTPEQAAFRAHCREWIASHHPGKPPVPIIEAAPQLTDPVAMTWLKAWQKSAYEAGLVGCDYPVAYGGGGRENCQAIANRELQLAKTPYFPNIVGLGIAGPPILHHAREDVKTELLPRLLSGEDIWCQGFSEPGAGSDLASLQTFARREGDNWVVNGHKVWTTLAHFADWMVLLCRTNKEDKYNGLTYFIVPIKAAHGRGVTVQPLIKMTGQRGFNQVLFDDLVVSDRYRMDEVGAGWKVAMTTLTHERGASALVTPAAGGMPMGDEQVTAIGSVDSLVTLARESWRDGQPAIDDPLLMDEIARLAIRHEAMAQNARRSLIPALTDQPARLALQSKLVSSELSQATAELAYRIEGAASSLYTADPNAPVGGQWQLSYMNSFGGTIAAGTSEVQRNILGERVLGLPKTK